jgi:hypothetical protein
METVYFTGIDQHKRTSFLTTLDQDGSIVRSTKLKNNPAAIRAYFGSLKRGHQATVETSTGWYWMSDLLASAGVELSLAHAKFVKAIMGRGTAQYEGQNGQGRRRDAGSTASNGDDSGGAQSIERTA